MASATFNLPQSLDERLRNEAESKLMSKSTLIRQILASHVQTNGGRAARPSSNKKGRK